MRIVVLGGSGNFGARICRVLQGDSEIELIVASRHPRDRDDGTGVQTVALDIGASGFAEDLRSLQPDLVIHCVGPFQRQDYRVVDAALAAGAHYLDLADGRAFVARFAAANDAAARTADRLAISGASTLPALSSAVIDALSARLATLESIDIAIAPGQRAPRGVATLEAVLSYLGRPFLWLRDGRWVNAYGWQEMKRVTFDCGRRWAAACDVPDLELLPQRYPDAKTVEFRAALELGVQHFALWLLAALRRCGIPIPVERWAGALNRTAAALDRLGSDCGGMRVSVVGFRADGSRRRLTWHLTAPDNHGPEIPCMAAILLARRFAKGQLAERGAHACMGFLTLTDFEPEFARWGIRARVEEGEV